MSLIAERWRRPVAGAAVVSFAVVAALAALVVHHRWTSFDWWMFKEMYRHVGTGGASTLLSFSTPAIAISLCAAVALLAALLRRWDVALLAVLGPTLTVVATHYVLKPLIGRAIVLGTFHVTGVFPSGHEAAVASTVWVLVIACFHIQLRRRTRQIVFAVLALWTVVAALGLIRNLWHYATDTIGSIFLSAGIVFSLALAIDQYGEAVFRRIQPRARRLTRSPSAGQP